MKIIKWSFLIGFLFSGLYHVLGLIEPAWTEPSPAWRHGVFVFVGLFSAWILYSEKKIFHYIFIPLILQQLYSHTLYGLEVFENEGRVDWASVIVCLTMPLLGFYIFRLKNQHLRNSVS